VLVTDFRDVLRLTGFAAQPEMLCPRDLFAALHPKDVWLIFADARHAPSPGRLAQAVLRSPQSRFVICGNVITEEMLETVTSGVHGVISNGMPIEEAAQALVRIWQGGRRYRQGSAYVRPIRPPPVGVDFDADWMFGNVV
jgi:hypothetical protein